MVTMREKRRFEKMSRDPSMERVISRGKTRHTLEKALLDRWAIDSVIRRRAHAAANATYRETIRFEAESWLPVLERELAGIDLAGSQEDYLHAHRLQEQIMALRRML